MSKAAKISRLEGPLKIKKSNVTEHKELILQENPEAALNVNKSQSQDQGEICLPYSEILQPPRKFERALSSIPSLSVIAGYPEFLLPQCNATEPAKASACYCMCELTHCKYMIQTITNSSRMFLKLRKLRLTQKFLSETNLSTFANKS